MSDVNLSYVNACEAILSGSPDNEYREGLKETPTRFARSLDFLTSGYGADFRNVLKTFQDGSEDYDELIIQNDIPVYSLCEHHLAPFFGRVSVGYVPSGKIIGLSKIARLVDIFSRRFQVQERLTQQIARTLFEALSPLGVGVVMHCRHLCLESRGVQKPGTVTTTSSLLGVLKDTPEARAEFLDLCKVPNGV